MVLDRARCLAAVATLTTILAACGGSGGSAPGGMPLGSPPAGLSTAPRTSTPALTPYRISLPRSADGPTTCTVYESDYATQIIVDSESLNVRAECEVWAANQADVGYLWGYERAGATSDVVRLCTLSDPQRKMTASVIEDTGFVPVTETQRARGTSACAAIEASGWTRPRHAPSSRRKRRARLG